MNVVYFYFLNILMLTVANDCECEVEPWTEWSGCSSTCGYSERTRKRVCSSCNGWTLCATCNDEDAKKWNAFKTQYKNCDTDPCRKLFYLSCLCICLFLQPLCQTGMSGQLVVKAVGNLVSRKDRGNV